MRGSLHPYNVIQVKVSYKIPLRGGCRRRRWHRLPFPSGSSQCRLQTSYGRPGPPCQPAGLCSVHVQPGME